MRKTCKTPLILAILTLSALLLAGCASVEKPGPADVWLLDGAHVRAWSKAAASNEPALSAQAAKCRKWVYVVTDTGLELMYKLDVHAPDETPQ